VLYLLYSLPAKINISTFLDAEDVTTTKNKILSQKNVCQVLKTIHKLKECLQGLEKLSATFTHKEIDQVVADMSSDKATRSEGFSSLFLKICWPVIKYEFDRLRQQF
jgi:hypothetical protein